MKEISKVKLNREYGQHALCVLGNRLKLVRKGWFGYDGDLPTVEDYKKAEREAFTHDASDLVSGAFSELESLRDELQDWYDNLPESFQSGDKGDQLQEAVSQLESASEVELPEWAKEAKVFAAPGDGTSRADRCSQACYELRQVTEALEAIADGEAKLPDQSDPTEEQKAKARSTAEELTSAADEAEATEFPGMY